ncbi:MAG: T9SS type A sorting domain-containing protein [Bacteroidales bacterium]|nr:T9SS type A sorting domain-containing protein [Bacteroidales bacterium]
MRISYYFSTLVLLSFLAIPKFADCQEWIKIFSSNNYQTVSYQLLEDYDKGIIIGANLSFGTIMKIGWIIKTDINGNILWEKRLGNGARQWGVIGIDKTPDGGVIVAGACDTLDNGWGDPFVVKLSACGEIEWCRVFNNVNDYDFGCKIKTLPDNSYIFLVKDWGEEFNSVWLMHLNVNGGIIWEQEYFLSDTLVVPYADNDLYLTSDGNYLVTGTCYRPISGQVQPYWLWPMMILADSTGEAVWETAWGYTLPFPEQVGGEGFQSVQTESGYYTCISNYHGQAPNYAPCLIKTSPSGEPVSFHDLIPNTAFGKASTINKLSDSVLFIGAWYKIPTVPPNLSVLKTDTLGNIIAEKVLNHKDYIPRDAIVTHDNKYLITAVDIVSNKYIFYLWKLNQDLGYDTVYTQPMVYDSLCPHAITNSTLYFNCDLAVGTGEQGITTEKVRMKVYPNPGHRIVHVKMPERIQKQAETEHFKVITTFHQWHKNLEFEVYDIFGKRVYKRIIIPLEKEFQIDVSAWKSGMYLFRLSYGGTMVADEKVIVNSY